MFYSASHFIQTLESVFGVAEFGKGERREIGVWRGGWEGWA